MRVEVIFHKVNTPEGNKQKRPRIEAARVIKFRTYEKSQIIRKTGFLQNS
jgi:hypothetical protein